MERFAGKMDLGGRCLPCCGRGCCCCCFEAECEVVTWRALATLTLALATTCSQSPSPCAITIANTANTATTPPHHHTRCAPSILTTAVAPRRSSNHRFAYPTSVFARLANPVCSTSKNTFMASHDSPSDDTAVTQNDRIKFRFCREWYNRPIAHPTRRTADSLRQLQHALPS